MITYKILDKYNTIAHFCTSREGGVSMGNYSSFNLSPYSGDIEENIAKNRLILCSNLGISPDRLIIPYQNHGTEIREVGNSFFELSAEQRTKYLNGVDALITNQAGVCIAISTADCVPLLFFDPRKEVIAAVHAGWRGTCNKITQKTIEYFIQHYNSDPKDILVSIGPSISSNVYEVGTEVIQNFENNGFSIPTIVKQRNNRIYLDLWEANSQLLQSLDIPAENIEISGICTFTEHERFFSARRLGIKSGRMISGIMIK